MCLEVGVTGYEGSGALMEDQLKSLAVDSVERALKNIIFSEGVTQAGDEDNLSYSKLCDSLISAATNHPNLACTLCEVVALLAKTEEFRKTAGTSALVASICPSLSSSDIATQIQALRAIGNLCFEEDQSREQCLQHDGHNVLCSLLKQCSSLPSVEEYTKFKSLVCGCILNLCCKNEKLCGAMLDLGIIELFSQLLSSEKDESVINAALQSLCVLLEADCCTIAMIMDSTLPESFIHLLKLYNSDASVDIMDHLIEVLETTLFDEEDSLWREKLVSSGCVNQLLSLTGSTESMEKVFNVINKVMISDNAMKMLFVNNDLWQVAVSHMRNTAMSSGVRAAAILAIGNLARTDSNCQELIKRDLLSDLVTILKSPSSSDSNEVWYSAMSTLRNLALPALSKTIFLQDGIIDVVIDVLNVSSDANIIMKAVGCLRLLSTTDDICKYLILTNPVITRIHTVCDMFSFPHIKIEGCRLTAALIKNCRTSEATLRLTDDDRVYPLLLYLVENSHELLKNEGLVALAIAASIKLDTTVKAMSSEEAMKSLLQGLQVDSSEVIENCLKLLQILITQSDDIVKAVKSIANFVVELKQLLTSENERIRKSVETIIEIIEK